MIAHLWFEHISAIVSLIWMWPWVRSLMIGDERFVWAKRDFVLSYMWWWYVNIFLICLALTLYILPNILTIWFSRFFFLWWASVCVIYLLSVWSGIYRIYHDKYWWNTDSLHKDLTSSRVITGSLWSLLPIYNLSRRYSQQIDNRTVREVVVEYSLFLFFSFLLLLVWTFWSPFFLWTLIMLLLARGIAWILWVDFVPPTISAHIASWMDRSWEEIVWTVVWYCIALWKRITWDWFVLTTLVEENKRIYREWGSYRWFHIVYFLLIWMLGWACYQRYNWVWTPMQHIWIAVVLFSLIGRYVASLRRGLYPRVPFCESVRQFFVS